MELFGMMVLALLLVLVLVALAVGWYYHASEGGFWNFWMAFNLMDLAGHVLTLLLAVIASMFGSDN